MHTGPVVMQFDAKRKRGESNHRTENMMPGSKPGTPELSMMVIHWESRFYLKDYTILPSILYLMQIMHFHAFNVLFYVLIQLLYYTPLFCACRALLCW